MHTTLLLTLALAGRNITMNCACGGVTPCYICHHTSIVSQVLNSHSSHVQEPRGVISQYSSIMAPMKNIVWASLSTTLHWQRITSCYQQWLWWCSDILYWWNCKVCKILFEYICRATLNCKHMKASKHIVMYIATHTVSCSSGLLDGQLLMWGGSYIYCK